MKTVLKKSFPALLAFSITLCGVYSCSGKDAMVLKMATTTSTDNTGLLDYLAPLVKRDTGIDLRWTAVGTGKALELGKNCDVDVLLVHDPDAEVQFMKDGYGLSRDRVMYNDFIIIGPQNDPAGIQGKPAVQAFKKIAATKSKFASRGDKSGTHMMETALWKKAGAAVPDREPWYMQTGQGMIDTITIAAERGAYTLADRATFYRYEAAAKGRPRLVILNGKDPALINRYSIIPVSGARCNNAKTHLAKKFSQWIVSPPAQKIIAEFKINGRRLFFPQTKNK